MITITARNRRRVFQLSLKALLLLVAVAATTCGWLKWKIVRKDSEREAVAEIEKIGGHAYYRWPPSYADHFAPPAGSGAAWLRKRLGEDFFLNVEAVIIFGDKATNQWLTHLEPLRACPSPWSLRFKEVVDTRNGRE